ncbi:Di-copper centre-containing protein [Cucurbitaria berberidis CBS 394.84]|uniref:tyrosinase n=1 Tax=Cucurbitaria berberidis CBS 394.84 TaxID=1168544 RepID=A0A9P4GBK0_9PLEO|nr:Di-copper centre-containing protein [Cucurbitaria berberidis CBS 394.84]KAF1842823.1 Di-copper centre-containing protein [Cucurbitaria berberidis CBS 394.84]
MPIPWVIRLLLPLSLISIAKCNVVSRAEHLRGRQSGAGLVSGVQSRDRNGNVFVRREVRDLKENYPDQWNLYLLGLEALHWTDQSDPYSFYGLAGVHGRPYKTWGNAPGRPDRIGSSGYCPHNNQLFLSWHRPYLTLFEQVLHERIQEIASRAPEDRYERYSKAARSFRMPYWDWAQGEKGGPVPDFFTTEMISVIKTDGVEKDMWNPLHTYRFHPVVPEDFEGKWANITKTLRWPTGDGRNATSQQIEFERSYNEQQRNILTEMGLVYRSSTFARFADRIEQPHGWIHGIVGGGWEANVAFKGHFWPLEYSAFEPLFMLHHANVDRLFALYQAAHPNSTMEPFKLRNGNRFLEDGQMVNNRTALLPFRKESGDFWTTKDCWNHTVLGYTYPETQPWKYDSDEDYRVAIKAIISNLYGGNARTQLTTPPASGGGHILLAKNGTFTDWTIETQASAHGLPPTFVVRFSLVGDFSSDPSIDAGTWMILMPTDHNSMAHTSRRAKQKSERASTIDQTLKGTVGLTAHLLDQVAAGKLKSLNSEDVVPYLKDKLTWKVYSGDGVLIPQSDLKALTVQVVSTTARIPDDPNVPVEYNEDVTAYPEVTIGKSEGVIA